MDPTNPYKRPLRGIACQVQRAGTGEVPHLERYVRVPITGDYVEVRDQRTQGIMIHRVWRVLLATDGRPPVVMVEAAT